MKLSDIAEQLGCRLDGDGTIEIRAVAGVEQAGPGDLTFLANPKYAATVQHTRASAIIVPDCTQGAPCAMLRTPHPYLAFAEALRLFPQSPTPRPGIDPSSQVAVSATIGDGVSIGPFVTVGEHAVIGGRTVIHPYVYVGDRVVVGERCVLHSHVAIRERVVLGNRVVVQNGVVIGSDGYGFVRHPDGHYVKIPQEAAVVIEDDVEIGANTTIDRPAVGETRIKAGAKIDNLVQIAHGVIIGRHTLLAAQVGVAGSAIVGDDVVLAGQVGVAGHIAIGDRARASAQTGIPRSVDAGAFVSGYPAIDNRDWLKSSAVFRRLPALRKQIADLEQRLAELEARLAASQTPVPR